MPELPEVETTRAGLAPHLLGRSIVATTLRRGDLRWPIAPEISALLPGQVIVAVRRRAKYLLLDTAAGSALLHLGMSGSVRVLPAATPVRAHDHVDLVLSDARAATDPATGQGGSVLRFNDPRRFGCLLWQSPGDVHPLLAGLGPEPLRIEGAMQSGTPRFDGDHLFTLSRGRSVPVKTFLMDQRVVVGVGNIYAAESLFAAGIAPRRAAGKVSRARYRHLADAVTSVLAHAIARGGTTLRDFISPDGAPGYFEQELSVYGRGGEPCRRCGARLRQALIGQRASVWCGRCQR